MYPTWNSGKWKGLRLAALNIDPRPYPRLAQELRTLRGQQAPGGLREAILRPGGWILVLAKKFRRIHQLLGIRD